MKRTALFGILVIAAIFLAVSCNPAGNTATVNFAITDAPVDSSTITAVKAMISSVAINESADANIADDAGSWTILSISPAREIDLLKLQNGVAEALGGFELIGGTQINQIRLGVDSVIITDGGVDNTATIPSKTGLKIVNSFDVPLSGAVTITIDFDARKSIVVTGGANISYKVKPVLRAVIDNEAGKITGTALADSVVYAYSGTSWNQTTETTANADGLMFTGAYASASAKTDGTYVLAYLDAGTYTLVSVKKADNSILKVVADVAVTAGTTTSAISTVP